MPFDKRPVDYQNLNSALHLAQENTTKAIFYYISGGVQKTRYTRGLRQFRHDALCKK